MENDQQIQYKNQNTILLPPPFSSITDSVLCLLPVCRYRFLFSHRHFVQANTYYTNQELERWALTNLTSMCRFEWGVAGGGRGAAQYLHHRNTVEKIS